MPKSQAVGRAAQVLSGIPGRSTVVNKICQILISGGCGFMLDILLQLLWDKPCIVDPNMAGSVLGAVSCCTWSVSLHLLQPGKGGNTFPSFLSHGCIRAESSFERKCWNTQTPRALVLKRKLSFRHWHPSLQLCRCGQTNSSLLNSHLWLLSEGAVTDLISLFPGWVAFRLWTA